MLQEKLSSPSKAKKPRVGRTLTQDIPRHKRPTNPKHIYSVFSVNRRSMNHTYNISRKALALPQLAEKHLQHYSVDEEVKRKDLKNLEGILTNQKKEVYSSQPTRRSKSHLSRTDRSHHTYDSNLSPSALELVEDARRKVNRKNSRVSTDQLIAKIPFPPPRLDRYPALVAPSSVASQTTNMSPMHQRIGTESAGNFLDSGRQSTENLKMQQQPEMATKALATITQNSEQFPKECYNEPEARVLRIESKGLLKKELLHSPRYESAKKKQKQENVLHLDPSTQSFLVSRMNETFLPPLKPSSFSYNRLGEAHVNLPLLRNEEVLRIKDDLPFSGEHKEVQNTKQEKRNNAFKKKLKAKYKKMVVRQRGELVEYATRQQKKSAHSPCLQPRPPSPEKRFTEEEIQAEEENYEFEGDTVGMPEDLQRTKWENQLNHTATNLPYQQATLSQLEGHYQTAQAFWGGGHAASLKRNLNSKTQLMASPTFGGGSLLDEGWEDEIKGTFRDKAGLNPHRVEHEMRIRVGVQGRKISQSVLPTKTSAISKELDTSSLQDQYLSVDEEMLEEALKTERTMVMLEASKQKEYSKTTILQHIGVRDSLDSNSGFSGTSRGLITRPSPLPIIQRKVTDGSNISQNMPMFPSSIHSPSPTNKKKGYLVNKAQLASSQAHLPVGVVKTPQFQKERKHVKNEEQSSPEHPLKANHQLKELPVKPKKLEHSKSICKHITLEIPIPQQNKTVLVPRAAGATSTLSMAPFTQSPLLMHGKTTLQNSTLKRSYAVMTSVKSPSISPTVFQTTVGSSLPMDPALVEAPIALPEASRSPMLLNDSPQHRRSCVFSHKEEPKQIGAQEEHDSPTPPYHDQTSGLKPEEEEPHYFNSTHDNIGQQRTMLLLNDYTDAMIDQGQQPELMREEQSPLLQNIRIVNDLVTQKVKSAFKTNLRLIKNEKYHQRGIDDLEGEKALMNRTSLDFPVPINVANQFIRLLSNSNRHKLRKFRDVDLMNECQPLTQIKPIQQRRNPFHNAALVMNQTTNADFEPLQGPMHGRKSTSLKIKIKDIKLQDDHLGQRKSRAKLLETQQRTLSHFANGNIYSPTDPQEQNESILHSSIRDVKKTEELRKPTRNVYSKVATPGLAMSSKREESESRDEGVSNQEEVAPCLQKAKAERTY